MKTSALIDLLKAALSEHGDLEVGIEINDYVQIFDPNSTPWTQKVGDKDRVLCIRWNEDDAREIVWDADQ